MARRGVHADEVGPEGAREAVVREVDTFADPGTVAAVEERYRAGGIGYGEVKARLADAIDAHVAPMRSRYRRLLADPAQLDARLARGEEHARRHADRTLARTMAAMGL